jgi:hypothetical protein
MRIEVATAESTGDETVTCWTETLATGCGAGEISERVGATSEIAEYFL